MRQVAQLAAAAVVLAFWGLFLSRSWSELQSYSWHVDLLNLTCAIVAGMAYWLSLGIAWQQSLRVAHGDLSLYRALGVWLRSMFMRYLPGNIWHVMGRVYLAEQQGQPRRAVLISAFVEQVLTLVGAAVAFGLSLPVWPTASGRWQWLIAVVPLGLAAVHPLVLDGGRVVLGRVQRGALAAFRQTCRWMRRMDCTSRARTGGGPVMHQNELGPQAQAEGEALQRVADVVTYGDVLRLVPWYVAPNVFGGVSLAFCLAALGPLQIDGALALGGIFAAGWMVGFLSVLTPSGLGVREAALALMLTPAYGLYQSVVASLLFRLALTLCEVILLLLWRICLNRR